MARDCVCVSVDHAHSLGSLASASGSAAVPLMPSNPKQTYQEQRTGSESFIDTTINDCRTHPEVDRTLGNWGVDYSGLALGRQSHAVAAGQ